MKTILIFLTIMSIFLGIGYFEFTPTPIIKIKNSECFRYNKSHATIINNSVKIEDTHISRDCRFLYIYGKLPQYCYLKNQCLNKSKICISYNKFNTSNAHKCFSKWIGRNCNNNFCQNNYINFTNCEGYKTTLKCKLRCNQRSNLQFDTYMNKTAVCSKIFKYFSSLDTELLSQFFPTVSSTSLKYCKLNDTKCINEIKYRYPSNGTFYFVYGKPTSQTVYLTHVILFWSFLFLIIIFILI